MADLPGRIPHRGRASQEVRVAPARVPREPPPAERETAPIGIIIPVRDRVLPLWNTLEAIRGQLLRPAWVVISDLGSSDRNSLSLQNLAKFFQVDYLRIEYSGPWNKGLAFNTALRNTPETKFVMQVDADVILSPSALAVMMRVLRRADAVVSVPAEIAKPKAYRPSVSRFRELAEKAEPMSEWSVGGCVVYPQAWLFETRGIDEAYEGWGNQDIDLWDRAQKALRAVRVPEIISLHQEHTPQKSKLDEANVEKNLVRRVSQWKGAELPVNPDGFGEGRVVHVP